MVTYIWDDNQDFEKNDPGMHCFQSEDATLGWTRNDVFPFNHLGLVDRYIEFMGFPTKVAEIIHGGETVGWTSREAQILLPAPLQHISVEIWIYHYDQRVIQQAIDWAIGQGIMTKVDWIRI